MQNETEPLRAEHTENKQMSKVIITGAGGFVGGELTRRFLESGTAVTAVSHSFGAAFPDDPLVTRIETSIVDPRALIEAIPEDEYTAFYHLAWRGVNGPKKADPEVQAENIKTALACAFAAKRLGAGKFLCAGTVAERGTESLPHLSAVSGGMLYGAAKRCAHILLEAYCKNIGLDFVWMQFSNIYGPHNSTGNLISYTLDRILSGEEATFGPALQPYDFIYSDDLIEAVFRLGNRKTDKNAYFIGSGEPRQLKDYLLEIGRITGCPDLIKIGARPDDGIVYSEEMFDISDLKETVGDYVKTSFSDGIAKTIAARRG